MFQRGSPFRALVDRLPGASESNTDLTNQDSIYALFLLLSSNSQSQKAEALVKYMDHVYDVGGKKAKFTSANKCLCAVVTAMLEISIKTIPQVAYLNDEEM